MQSKGAFFCGYQKAEMHSHQSSFMTSRKSHACGDGKVGINRMAKHDSALP